MSNPVSEIAYLIKTSLQERCDFSPEDNPYLDYLRQLATLMGLSFTATLVEGSRIRTCRSHLTTFLRYRDFIQHVDKLESLSIAIAETVCNSIRSFKLLGFPLYYDSLVHALIYILKSQGATHTIKEAGIKQIMQQLLEGCN